MFLTVRVSAFRSMLNQKIYAWKDSVNREVTVITPDAIFPVPFVPVYRNEDENINGKSNISKRNFCVNLNITMRLEKCN